jgi:hypothetical protein
MTRRDAAVLLFVAAGIYSVLVALSFLAALIQSFAPPVTFRPDFNPTVMVASYLVPFGLLLAGGRLLIRGRHALANQLFDKDEALPTSSDQAARVHALGSIALAVLGFLCLLEAVPELTATIQLVQPRTWHTTSVARTIIWSVLHPALVTAYLWLAWSLLSQRDRLAARWLTPDETPSQQPDSQSRRLEAVAFRVVGLYFAIDALRPMSHALPHLLPGGDGTGTADLWWGFWPDAARGTVQLLLGLGLFLGKKGLAAAWQKLAYMREV